MMRGRVAGVDELATFFRTAAHSGSLVCYLEPFAHTVGVMQTPEALQLDMPVEVVFEPQTDTITLPLFRPVKG